MSPFHVSPLRPYIDLLLPPAISLSSQSLHPHRPFHIFPYFLCVFFKSSPLTFFLSRGSTVYIINVISSERFSVSILHPSPWSLSVFSSVISSHEIPHSFSSSTLYSPQSDSFLWVYFYLSLSLTLSMFFPPVPCNQCSVDERYD